MAVSQWMIWATVLFLLLLVHGTQSSPGPPGCPVAWFPCLCPGGPLLNCSSTGLSSAPSRLPGSVTDLDLSHNLLNSLDHQRPSQGLQRLWLGHNRITHLSLCVGRRGRRHPQTRSAHTPRSRRRCVPWAPGLQLLSAERNQLEELPEGLGGSEFLQVLQLSYNQISALQPGELSQCTSLRELHLQHNRITSLHPQALRDLPELRVLDLSFNLLTSIAPSSYLSLRNLKGLVDVQGNRWRCDCSMRSLRRWMAYDRDRDRVQQTWRVVCASPSALSGRDLSHMEDDDLTCSTAETGEGLHREVTVNAGATITLPCGSPQEDSTWWTPNSHVSVSRAGLLIRDIAEQDTGLYVCVSGPDEESVHVFYVHVHKTGQNLMTRMKTRGARGLRGELEKQQLGSRQRDGQEKNLGSSGLQRISKTQSDLILAVCLSILITFLVAFVIGALVRPFLDTCWRKYRAKKSPTPARPVSSDAGQRPYDNDGYSDGEEPDGLGGHMERRVTFSHPSQTSVPYYDTVASGRQDNLQGDVVAVVEPGATYENIQRRSEARDSVSSHSSHSSSQHDRDDTPQSGDGAFSGVSPRGPQGDIATHNTANTRGMEFEPIPDPDETDDRRRRRRLSESSFSDREGSSTPHNNPWEPQCPRQVEDTLQRSDVPVDKPDEMPQITVSTGGIPGFSSEPFADWKPNTTDLNQTDPELWNDSGESFEFAESIQGASARSSSQNLSGSIHQLKQDVPPPSDALEQSGRSSSSSSIDSDSEPTVYIVNPDTEVMGDEVKNVLHTHDSTLSDIVNPYLGQDVSIDQLHSASPSSESEDETGDHKKYYEAKATDFTTEDSSFRYPTDIKAPLAPSRALNINFDNSASSTDAAEGRAKAEESSRPTPEADLPPEAMWADLGLGAPRLQKRLVVDVQPSQTAPADIPRTPSPSDHSSSSSGSEDETKGHSVTRQREEDKAPVPDVTTKDSSFRYPTDIKVPLAPRRGLNINFDNSENRASVDNSSPTSEAVSEPKARWAGMGLNVPQPQKRLVVQPPQTAQPDIPQTPPPSYSSSSSSESEDETRDHKVKLEREQGDAKIPDVTTKDSYLRYPTDINVSLAPRRAPKIALINANTASNTYEVENRASVDNSSPTSEAVLEPKARWAGLGLNVPQPQKRLVVQPPQTPPPSDSSSSSSESEDETRHHKVKLEREQGDAKIPDVTTKDSYLRYPTDINVSLAPRKALNIGLINANTASNTYEVENRTSIENSSPTSEAVSEPEAKWAGLGLGIPRFQKHPVVHRPQTAPPNIPQTPPPSDSSSSSNESEDETRDSTVKLEREQGDVKIPDVTTKDSFLTYPTDINVSLAPRRALNIGLINANTASNTYEVENRASVDYSSPTSEAVLEPKARWAGLGLNVPQPQKRLVVQPPQTPPPLDSSSSSSESEDETRHHKVKLEREQVDAKIPDVTTKDSYLRYPTDINVSLAPRRAPKIALINANTASNTNEVENRTSIDNSSPTSEPEAKWAGLGLGIPRFQQRPVIQRPQTPPHSDSSSSSSESEDETRDSTVKLEREQGDVKIPDVTTKDSYLTYPTDINVSLAPRRALNIGLINANTASNTYEVENRTSIDYRSPTSEAVLEPKARWAGLGLNVPQPQKRLVVHRPQTAPPNIPQTPPRSDSSSSSSESEDETRDHTVKLKYVTHSPADTHIPVSFAPRRDININFDNSASSPDEVEGRDRAVKSTGGDRPGQGSLKAQWSEYEEIGFAEETKPPAAQLSLPKTPHRLSSTLSEGGMNAGESPLHIPRNRNRLAVDVQPPQTAPSDVPVTPPPSSDGQEASAGSPWRPSQDFRSKVLSQQRKKAMDGFGIGLMGTPTPYRTARQYQSVTSETLTTTTTTRTENTSMQISGSDGSDYSDLNMTFSDIKAASESLHFETNKGGSEA